MIKKEAAVLAGSTLLQGIVEEDRERLLACLGAEEARYEKGSIIWHMGDPIRACALVLSGAVRAEAVNASGEHSLMAFHRAGALVGDVLMATPGSRSPVYVTAAEDVTLLFLPYSAIMGGCARCCDAHRRLRENLIAEIAQKFWAQRQRAGYLAVHSLRGRIAMYLLDQRGDTFCLGLTREDLADFLCVNRSALSRELSRMKQEGLVDFYRDTFRIPDREALSRFTL